MNGAERHQVEECFEGGLALDSILGVELACSMELKLQIRIPEKLLLNTKLYASLATFATVVQQCLNERGKTTQPGGGE